MRHTVSDYIAMTLTTIIMSFAVLTTVAVCPPLMSTLVWMAARWGPSIPAQAEPVDLTLACQGTMTDAAMTDAKPEPVSIGVVVNFTTRTVEGFHEPLLFNSPMKITAMNDVTVVFKGFFDRGLGVTRSTSGAIDRVTGDVEGGSVLSSRTNIVSSITYSLKCRPDFSHTLGPPQRGY
jgi:hypothetical protein